MTVKTEVGRAGNFEFLKYRTIKLNNDFKYHSGWIQICILLSTVLFLSLSNKLVNNLKLKLLPNRFYKTAVILCCFLISGIFPSEPVIAQQSENTFKTFEIGFTSSVDVSRNLFHNYWEQNLGLGIQFQTPFYFGHIEALGEIFSYRGIGEGTIDGRAPDFLNIFLAAGWGKKFQITPSLKLYGGFFAGNSLLNFEQHPIYGKAENEITAGLNLNIGYHFSDTWLIRVGARQTRMYTFHRINLTHLTFGVSRKLESPEWLQNFFK